MSGQVDAVRPLVVDVSCSRLAVCADADVREEPPGVALGPRGLCHGTTAGAIFREDPSLGVPDPLVHIDDETVPFGDVEVALPRVLARVGRHALEGATPGRPVVVLCPSDWDRARRRRLTAAWSGLGAGTVTVRPAAEVILAALPGCTTRGSMVVEVGALETVVTAMRAPGDLVAGTAEPATRVGEAERLERGFLSVGRAARRSPEEAAEAVTLLVSALTVICDAEAEVLLRGPTEVVEAVEAELRDRGRQAYALPASRVLPAVARMFAAATELAAAERALVGVGPDGAAGVPVGPGPPRPPWPDAADAAAGGRRLARMLPDGRSRGAGVLAAVGVVLAGAAAAGVVLFGGGAGPAPSGAGHVADGTLPHQGGATPDVAVPVPGDGGERATGPDIDGGADHGSGAEGPAGAGRAIPVSAAGAICLPAGLRAAAPERRGGTTRVVVTPGGPAGPGEAPATTAPGGPPLRARILVDTRELARDADLDAVYTELVSRTEALGVDGSDRVAGGGPGVERPRRTALAGGVEIIEYVEVTGTRARVRWLIRVVDSVQLGVGCQTAPGAAGALERECEELVTATPGTCG